MIIIKGVYVSGGALLGRREVLETVRDGAEKAGSLVAAVLAVATVALLVAVSALVLVVKVRGTVAA